MLQMLKKILKVVIQPELNFFTLLGAEDREVGEGLGWRMIEAFSESRVSCRI